MLAMVAVHDNIIMLSFFTLRYSFMQLCWSLEPEHRPAFSQLVETLSSSLEGMAGYVHIGAFEMRTQNVPEDDNLRDS